MTFKQPQLKIFFSEFIFWLLGFCSVWQLGKHFWPDFSYFSGLRVDYLSPTVFFADVILLTAIILKLIESQKIWPKFSLPLKILILLLVVNFIIAINKFLFVYRLFQYLKIAGSLFLFSKITKKQWQSFLKGLSLAVLLTLGLSCAQIINQGSLQNWWYFLGERSFTINSPGVATISLEGQKIVRAYASFSHPNSLAGFFLPLIFVFLTYKRPLIAVSSLFLVILSFSKFHLVLMALLLLFWFWPTRKNCRLCQLGQLGLILWLVLLAIVIQGDPSSLSARLNSYWLAFIFIINHPLGTGLGHYLIATPLSQGQPVHNLFLLITLEWGWLIWVIILNYFQGFIKIVRKHKLNIYLLTTILITSSFDHYHLTLPQNMLLLGIILGIIIGNSTKKQIQN